MKAVSNGPVKDIILTHGHGDHTGGAPLWKEPGTHIIEQANSVEFRNYQTRLAGFFAVRAASSRPSIRSTESRSTLSRAETES